MSAGRRRAVADMKQEALQSARRRGDDFIWFLDADVILYDRAILRELLDMRKPIVAPLLRSTGGHTNFQSSLDENDGLMSGERFLNIHSRQQLGCFAVPLVRSCVLVDLRDPRTAGLTFLTSLTFLSETGPEQEVLDDAVSLALSARRSGLEMSVCNQEDFGLVPPPLRETQNLSDEWRNMVNMKLKALVDRPPLPVEPLMRLFLPTRPVKSRLGLDRIYTIGLERRPERWRRQQDSFNELGIEFTRVHAVDGLQLTAAFLAERNISSPDRIKLKRGEIGCFLSHYSVWQDMLDNDLERVLILEDDAHPTAEFPERLQQLVAEADRLRPQWDFIYLFREHADPADDEPVEGAEQLVRPGFCYGAVAYLLTRRGAEKLLGGRPLGNMVCVDDYIPLMAGTARISEYLDMFPGMGTMRTFSSRDDLITPVKVRAQPGYVSDTSHYVSDTSQVYGVNGEQSCSAAEHNAEASCLSPYL